MSWISKTFFAGLMAFLPITLTAAVLYWLGNTAESLLGPTLKAVLPARIYHPGMGLAAGVILIFFTGILLQVWATRWLFERGEKALARVPLVKTLYAGIRDLLGYFSKPAGKPAENVVLVTPAGGALRMVGLVTREDFADVPFGAGAEGMVAVYCPLSYQVGGVTLLVPRSSIERIPMKVEDAMRFAMTAGVSMRGER